MGVVARDHVGAVIFAANRRVHGWPPEVAEGKAILLAVKLASQHGLSHVIFESDSEVFAKRLKRAAVFLSDLNYFGGCSRP